MAPCSPRGLFPVLEVQLRAAGCQSPAQKASASGPTSNSVCSARVRGRSESRRVGTTAASRPALGRGRAPLCPLGLAEVPPGRARGGRGRGALADRCRPAQALYLDAVEYFPDELQEVVDLMTEKELRVRLPLEELELLLE